MLVGFRAKDGTFIREANEDTHIFIQVTPLNRTSFWTPLEPISAQGRGGVQPDADRIGSPAAALFIYLFSSFRAQWRRAAPPAPTQTQQRRPSPPPGQRARRFQAEGRAICSRLPPVLSGQARSRQEPVGQHTVQHHRPLQEPQGERREAASGGPMYAWCGPFL